MKSIPMFHPRVSFSMVRVISTLRSGTCAAPMDLEYRDSVCFRELMTMEIVEILRRPESCPLGQWIFVLSTHRTDQ
ncbi:hypothetical protein B0H16DRAFT_1505404 [Mycena metata]|uniref:Uncharacterized protein n=1 Tax=Mycena metata TaxID=1033252 RepID=A0AAD7K3H7_9AGAR|nr:hypothetical protein B0H16DRAFT_1505404 [Mycena metata]